MDRTAFIMSLGFGILILTAQHAFPQGNSNCAPRELALKQLAEKWGETRRSVMLSNDRVFEVFAADESGTWTILRTTPDGLSCVMAAGVAYEKTALPAGSPA
jgi:hypothetical protein